MIHKVNILSTGTFLHKNFHREVMFLRNMQANYVSYKSTFVIEKPLPQNLLNIKKINSIFKIFVHAPSNLKLRLRVDSSYHLLLCKETGGY